MSRDAAETLKAFQEQAEKRKPIAACRGRDLTDAEREHLQDEADEARREAVDREHERLHPERYR